jgi:glucose-1-phosphate thymidylyltransferase
MKGIILAGGSGTRLYPMTLSVSKQILPVYNKPLIYYPLSVLMLGGIRSILVISSPRDLPSVEALLGDGGQWGISLTYAEQAAPEGIAQAFQIGKTFVGTDHVALVLGDNIFFGHGLVDLLADTFKERAGATVFIYKVRDPERYGVVAFDNCKRVTCIEEKPKKPKSQWAVTGLYVYDNQVIDIAKGLKRSSRGEFEITDVNMAYLKQGTLFVEKMGRGFAWFDAGTPDNLLNASNYVATLEKRQGLMIASPEEIAFTRGLISGDDLCRLINHRYAKTDYEQYLRSLLSEE